MDGNKETRMREKRGLSWLRLLVGGILPLLFVVVGGVPDGEAAGIIKPKNGPEVPVTIRSHKVDVTINNGFARTEVDQVFANAGDRTLEGIYTFPLPKKSSLSELSIWVDGKEWLGEVVEKERARKIYEAEKQQGKDTALAEKNDFKTFDISVGSIPAGGERRVRIVYYQPLEIDLNVGRYLYPLAEGGVDDERISFWQVDDKVEGPFSFRLHLKSAFPVKDVRLPGLENEAKVTKGAVGEHGETWEVELDRQSGNLAKDIVFYYRLNDAVPARVELIPYRASAKEKGTFMVVVTPAADLKKIAEGIDWTFILDTSGSMTGGKIETLQKGVGRVLSKLSPADRFRIITFNNSAHELTGGYRRATAEESAKWAEEVKRIQANGGTDLYSGIAAGYKGIDADRTQGVVLVTDGVANIGATQHAAFLDLVKKYDIRLFTFVIGNSANQPLLDTLAGESGGFAMNISESDDIGGRLLQAKAKVLHQALTNVRLTFHGEKVKDLTPAKYGPLYAGEQLVMFGHYTHGGEVEVELTGNVTGEAKSWKTTAVLPETDLDNPEIERLWASSAIEDAMTEVREKGENETLRGRVTALGTQYSLVTDYTSMVVAEASVMEKEGVGRANAERVERERQAQAARAQASPRNYQVGGSGGGMFGGRPGVSIGAGPVGPLFIPVAFWLVWRRRKN